MSVANFIQTIWSKKIQDALELKCKLVDNCLRDYEGDCKYARTVKILGVGEPTIAAYDSNVDITIEDMKIFHVGHYIITSIPFLDTSHPTNQTIIIRFQRYNIKRFKYGRQLIVFIFLHVIYLRQVFRLVFHLTTSRQGQHQRYTTQPSKFFHVFHFLAIYNLLSNIVQTYVFFKTSATFSFFFFNFSEKLYNFQD